MRTKNIIAAAIIIFLSNNIFPQTKEITAEKNGSSITYKLTHPLHEIESTSKNVSCVIDMDESSKDDQKS